MNQQALGAIGFIGVGHMGFPMVRNLLRAGYQVKVYDRDQEKSTALTKWGAQHVSTPSETAHPDGIVLSMVPDNAALLEIVAGQNGLISVLGAQGIHVSMSTISPTTSMRVASLYAEHGTSYVAATVSGRPDDAHNGQLAMFYAGPQPAKDRILPLLRSMGNSEALYDLGERVETANAMKLAINFPIGVIIVALAVSAAMAERYGIPRQQFFSRFLASPMFRDGKVFSQYSSLIQQGIDARGFDVDLGKKDVLLTQESAREVDMPLPFAPELLAYLQEAIDRGWGKSDWSAIAAIIMEQTIPFADVSTHR